jgi:hypothetical protein
LYGPYATRARFFVRVDRTCFGHADRRFAFARRRRASGVFIRARRAASRAFFFALASFFRADIAARRAFFLALIAWRFAFRAAICSGVPRRVLRRGAARCFVTRDRFDFTLRRFFFFPNVAAYPEEYAFDCGRDIERERFGRMRRFAARRRLVVFLVPMPEARLAPATVSPRFRAALNAARRLPARFRAAELPIRVPLFFFMRRTNAARWTPLDVMLPLLPAIKRRALATRSARVRFSVAARALP